MLCDILYKRLRNTLTYLLTYLMYFVVYFSSEQFSAGGDSKINGDAI